MNVLMMGGFPSAVILVFGVLAVSHAARFAWAPGEGRVPHLVALGGIVTVAAVGGVAVDLQAVAFHVAARAETLPGTAITAMVAQGLGEALVPATLGAGFLLAQALLVALGLRRLQA